MEPILLRADRDGERADQFIARLVPEPYHEAVFFDNANRIYGLGL